MAVTSLANYSFAWNDYIFGAGSAHPISDVLGLEALPNIRNQDDNRGYSDGMFSGNDFTRSDTSDIKDLDSLNNLDGLILSLISSFTKGSK